MHCHFIKSQVKEKASKSVLVVHLKKYITIQHNSKCQYGKKPWQKCPSNMQTIHILHSCPVVTHMHTQNKHAKVKNHTHFIARHTCFNQPFQKCYILNMVQIQCKCLFTCVIPENRFCTINTLKCIKGYVYLHQYNQSGNSTKSLFVSVCVFNLAGAGGMRRHSITACTHAGCEFKRNSCWLMSNVPKYIAVETNNNCRVLMCQNYNMITRYTVVVKCGLISGFDNLGSFMCT